MPKAIVIVSIIVLYGIFIGAVGYILTHNEPIWPEPVAPPISENKCELKVKFDPLCPNSILVYGYEYDSNLGICKAVNAGGGCSLETPFNSFEECKASCKSLSEIRQAAAGEDFLITLDANPSTGYSWEATYDENYIKMRSKDFVSDGDGLGAGGKEVFTFAPIKAGETMITMGYGRPWESKAIEIKVFKYNIIESKEVAISTDATEYEPGEIVKITIRNSSAEKMRIEWPLYNIERLNNGIWETVKKVNCPCGAKCKVGPAIISANQELKYQWGQKEEWCNDFEKISNTAMSGIYKARTQISNEDGSNKRTIYSNEFIIKERTAIDSITDFYSCSENSDCILVKAGCCGCNAGGNAKAINKNFKMDWKGECEEIAPVMCPSVMSDDPSCFKKPTCVSNKCVLE